jgi:Cu/Ag efflux protein CusF
MLNIRRAFMAVAALVLAGGMVAVLAAQQQPDQQPGGQAPQASMARGELVSVDANAKTLTVRTDKAETQFAYNDRTEVIGAKEGVAGLASVKGSQVTVHFTRQGQSNIASRIEVSAKQP